MEAVRTHTLSNEYVFRIYPDEFPESPREWDNLGVMHCAHKRYDLGDVQIDHHQFGSWDEIFDHLKENGAAVVLPLFLMDHSGLSMRVDSSLFRAVDTQGWDWGQVGFIVADADAIKKEYQCEQITDEILEKVNKVLVSEVELYNAYIQGFVYGYTLCDTDDNEVESCWGFFGVGDNPFADMLDHISDEYATELREVLS